MARSMIVSSSTFPVTLDDGRPRFVYDLAEALADHARVCVIAPDGPEAKTREWIGRVEVRRFTYFVPRRLQRLAGGAGIRVNLEGSHLAKFQVPSFVAAQTWALRRLLRETRAEIVNTHWLVPQGFTAALARDAGSPFTHAVHVHAADVYLLRRLRLGGPIARYVLSRSDVVFADGSHVRDTLDRVVGFASGAELQPMGVDAKFFRDHAALDPMPSPFEDGYVLFVGRFVEKKGVVYLLRALPRVLARHPGLGLVLAGFGPLEAEYRAEAVEMGIENRVHFTGKQTHREIVRWLRGSRASIVPSIVDSTGETEGMPTVVSEALAAGARVVGTAVDGIPDIIRHRENGWLCREKDPEDLAAKILDALSESSPSILEAAAGTAEDLDWHAVAHRYMARILAASGRVGKKGRQ